MEHLWNEIDRGKPKYSEQTLSHCHFVHHKSHIDRHVIEPGPPRWETGESPPEPWWHGLVTCYFCKIDFVLIKCTCTLTDLCVPYGAVRTALDSCSVICVMFHFVCLWCVCLSYFCSSVVLFLLLAIWLLPRHINKQELNWLLLLLLCYYYYYYTPPHGPR